MPCARWVGTGSDGCIRGRGIGRASGTDRDRSRGRDRGKARGTYRRSMSCTATRTQIYSTAADVSEPHRSRRMGSEGRGRTGCAREDGVRVCAGLRGGSLHRSKSRRGAAYVGVRAQWPAPRRCVPPFPARRSYGFDGWVQHVSLLPSVFGERRCETGDHVEAFIGRTWSAAPHAASVVDLGGARDRSARAQPEPELRLRTRSGRTLCLMRC